MSTQKVCEQCGNEMKLVPPGFSRTKNKPYGAFWSCDRRANGCGKTEKAEGQDAAAAAPVIDASGMAQLNEKLDRIILALNA